MSFYDDIQNRRNMQGVYFLIHENNVVYVGSSKNIYYRALEHKVEGKKVFDKIGSMHYNEINIDIVRVIEMALICRIKPKLNKLVFDDFKKWFYSVSSFSNVNVELEEINRSVDSMLRQFDENNIGY